MLYCLINVLLYFICYSKLLFYPIIVCVNLHSTSFHNLYIQVPNFMNIFPVLAELFSADRQTDMIELTAAFCDIAKASY
jgi:hypothetical protein